MQRIPAAFPLYVGLVTASLAVHVFFCPPTADASDDTLIAITMPKKEVILAELADTTEKRARGLMFRTHLPMDRGMLFTFPEPQRWTFWMKNTRIPLDIIWLDQKKRIVYIERRVPGCSRTDDSCMQYQPNHDALYVLEVAAGVADALQLKVGDPLTFHLPPQTPPLPGR